MLETVWHREGTAGVAMEWSRTLCLKCIQV